MKAVTDKKDIIDILIMGLKDFIKKESGERCNESVMIGYSLDLIENSTNEKKSFIILFGIKNNINGIIEVESGKYPDGSILHFHDGDLNIEKIAEKYGDRILDDKEKI